MQSTEIKLHHAGYTLTQTPKDKSCRHWHFMCDATGKGYNFGPCHSECVDAMRSNDLTILIDNYKHQLGA